MRTTALVVSRIVAEHEEAEKFNADLEAMLERRTKLVKWLQLQAEAECAKLTMEYAYGVVSAQGEPFISSEALVGSPIRVSRIWLNKAEWEAVARLYGYKCPEVPERVLSPIYYRVGKVVVRLPGPGYEVVKHNVLVSDEEWNNLKQGQVPETLLNGR
jgi:hypothetical protein